MADLAPTSLVVRDILRTARRVDARRALHPVRLARWPPTARSTQRASATPPRLRRARRRARRARRRSCCPNSIEYVELYFGLAYRGAAVVLVNTAFRGYMLEYVLNDAACPVLIADAEYLPALLRVRDQLSSTSRPSS